MILFPRCPRCRRVMWLGLFRGVTVPAYPEGPICHPCYSRLVREWPATAI